MLKIKITIIPVPRSANALYYIDFSHLDPYAQLLFVWNEIFCHIWINYSLLSKATALLMTLLMLHIWMLSLQNLQNVTMFCFQLLDISMMLHSNKTIRAWQHVCHLSSFLMMITAKWGICFFFFFCAAHVSFERRISGLICCFHYELSCYICGHTVHIYEIQYIFVYSSTTPSCAMTRKKREILTMLLR